MKCWVLAVKAATPLWPLLQLLVLRLQLSTLPPCLSLPRVLEERELADSGLPKTVSFTATPYRWLPMQMETLLGLHQPSETSQPGVIQKMRSLSLVGLRFFIIATDIPSACIVYSLQYAGSRTSHRRQRIPRSRAGSSAIQLSLLRFITHRRCNLHRRTLRWTGTKNNRRFRT